MDMSLDDIINTRRDNKGSLRGRRNLRKPDLGRQQLNGRINRPGIRRAGPNIPSPNRRGLNRPVSSRPGPSRSAQSNNRPGPSRSAQSNSRPVIDARSKIIQKNRQKMADARDKLGEIAKKSDARLKLLKLKQSNLKVTAQPSPSRSTNLRNNIIKARISNVSPRQNFRMHSSRERFGRGSSRGRLDLGLRNEGRIDLMRNRLSESPRGANLKRLINNDLIAKNRNQGVPLNFRSQRHGTFDRPLLKRSVENDEIEVIGNPIVWRESNKEGFRSVPQLRRPQEGVFQRNNFLNTYSNDRNNLDFEEELRGNDEVLMRTFSNQRGRSEMDNFPVKMSRPSQIKVVMRNDSSTYIQKQHQLMEVDEEYEHYFKQPAQPLTLAKPSRSFIDHFSSHGSEDGHLIHAVGVPRMSQEMLARLDTPAPVPRSMGILSSQGPQPASMNADIGHRIVVSNLQPSVTHEDIKELFEDIGPLLASRVVRPGTAEVIYNLQKDAKKAVEAYHNRQLDGQPMKCMLVNPRALPMNPSSIGGLRSPALHAKIPSSSKSSVMPDLTAIHKALFSK